MSRHRFCMTPDRDGFIEEFAQELWEDRSGGTDEQPWEDASPEEHRKFIKLASETLRILEHGHG